MNVTQDLMDWLNSKNSSSEGTGLLLAPVGGERESRPENRETLTNQDNSQEILSALFSGGEPKNFSENNFVNDTENFQQNFSEEENFSQEPQEISESNFQNDEPENFSQDNFVNDAENFPQEISEEENFSQEPQEISESILQNDEPKNFSENNFANDTENFPQNFSEEENFAQEQQEISESNFQNDEPEEIPQPDKKIPSGLSENWREAAKNTGFVLSLDEPPPEIWTRINAEDTDEEEDYEQGTSLQGAAYVPKHGANFTQRLQKTLHDRKLKAAEKSRREKENDAQNSNHMAAKTFLMCAALILTLAISWVALMFLQSAKITRDKAVNIAQIELAQEIISQDIQEPEPEPEPEKEPQKQEVVIKLPQIKPKTFDDFLREANNAFNIKMYNQAAMNFFNAMAVKSNDIRPYIGLAASYRAKGLFFDAKVILDEARKKFGDNPTIEAEEKFLQRE